MKFGLNFVNGGALADPEPAADLAMLAEELGFSTLWTGNHVVLPVTYASRYPRSVLDEAPFDHDTAFADPFPFLSFIAAFTKTVRLGTGVHVLAQHNPLEIAKAVATVDRLSGGRVTFGVGTGWLREEFELLGAPWEHRVERTIEGLEVLRRLWAAPGASFAGEHFRFDAITCSPRPVQQPRVPIVIGGYVAAAARRAGRLADGHYPGPASPQQVRSYRDEIARGAAEAGRAAIEVKSIVAAPYDRPLTLELCREYEAAGVDEIAIMVPEAGNYPAQPVADGWFAHTRQSLIDFKATIMDPMARVAGTA